MPAYIQVIVNGAADINLSGGDKTFLARLALRARGVGVEHQIVVRLREIGAEMNAGIATLSRSLTKLERAGYISRDPTRQIGAPSRITILPPAPTDDR